MKRNSAKIKGFTLLEALVTVAMMGLIGLKSLPMMSDLVAKERRVTEINKVINMIRYTRNQALTKQKIVTFCPSSDSNQCSTNWNLPFMVFVDLDNNRIRSTNEPLLKRFAAIPKQDKLTWKAFRYRNALQFLPFGMTNHQNGTFLYCPFKTRHDLSKGIIMTKLGRTRLSKDRNGDGFQQGASNRTLTCI